MNKSCVSFEIQRFNRTRPLEEPEDEEDEDEDEEDEDEEEEDEEPEEVKATKYSKKELKKFRKKHDLDDKNMALVIEWATEGGMTLFDAAKDLEFVSDEDSDEEE